MRVGVRAQPQPRERNARQRSPQRPLGAVDGLLPPNRWRVAGRPRPRVGSGGARSRPGGPRPSTVKRTPVLLPHRRGRLCYWPTGEDACATGPQARTPVLLAHRRGRLCYWPTGEDACATGPQAGRLFYCPARAAAISPPGEPRGCRARSRRPPCGRRCSAGSSR